MPITSNCLNYSLDSKWSILLVPRLLQEMSRREGALLNQYMWGVHRDMPAPRQHVEFVSPKELQQNPENPRLIFRENDLQTLFESISLQGILVPLTVFRKSARTLVLLDGERRWRCAIKLGLSRVPVIIQPEPARLQNIMMMFAI